MTFPIQQALLHPERTQGVEPPLDLTRALSLEFRPIDEVRFPMIRLAREVMEAGGITAAVFNAANEVAVQAFLEGKLPFLAISRVVEQTLAETRNFEPADLPSVMAADAEARRFAAQKAATLGP
jgi:1-deoxy-D-xylulose-5-phosphate reductoisomerase